MKIGLGWVSWNRGMPKASMVSSMIVNLGDTKGFIWASRVTGMRYSACVANAASAPAVKSVTDVSLHEAVNLFRKHVAERAAKEFAGVE